MITKPPLSPLPSRAILIDRLLMDMAAEAYIYFMP